MAPQPVEQTGESTAGDAHRSLPTPFLTKTYQLVDDTDIDDVISWNEDGSTFIVWKPADFARDLLPKYFKHNNFSSFVRQLNTYGFRKIVPDRWEFANDYFRKGEKRLLCDIHRRKISPTVTGAVVTGSMAAIPIAIPVVRTGSPSNSGEEQVLSSNSPPVTVSPKVCRPTSCSSTSDLIDENERLRRENQHLNQELSQMKSLCNNILVLMNKYASSQQQRENNSGFPVEKPLDLMPLRRLSEESEAVAMAMAVDGGQSPMKIEEEERPRLFGVPIGAKRSRREEDEQEQEREQNGIEIVKSEPLDSGSSQHDSAWMGLHVSRE